MEIDIDSKKENPLLDRTEVHFTVRHEGENTPNREIVRNELAEKLNVKKDNVVVDRINSGFGAQESKGYAKVYKSVEKSKNWEREHILIRNKLLEKKTKDKKSAAEKPQVKPEEGTPKKEEKKATEEKKPSEGSKEEPEKPPVEEPPKSEVEKPTEDKKDEPEEKPVEEKKPDEQPAEDKKE